MCLLSSLWASLLQFFSPLEMHVAHLCFLDLLQKAESQKPETAEWVDSFFSFLAKNTFGFAAIVSAADFNSLCCWSFVLKLFPYLNNWLHRLFLCYPELIMEIVWLKVLILLQLPSHWLLMGHLKAMSSILHMMRHPCQCFIHRWFYRNS